MRMAGLLFGTYVWTDEAPAPPRAKKPLPSHNTPTRRPVTWNTNNRLYWVN